MAEQRTLDAERAAFDKLLAAAQVVVNEGLDAAEERAHPCDVNDDEVKARLMPAPLQALYYAIQAARRAPPALDTEGLPAQWHERMAKQGWKPDQHAYHASKAAYMEEEIADLRAQLASERQAKEYEQRHAAESEVALAKVHAQLARTSAPEGAPVGMEAVAWLEAEASARNQTAKAVLNSFIYSARVHTKAAPVTSNPVWPLYASTSASAQPESPPQDGEKA